MDESNLKQLEARIGDLERRFNAHVITGFLAQSSKIHPKSKTVVFVGETSFADNIKYAFLAFQKIAAGHGVRCFYLTEEVAQRQLLASQGLPVLSSSDPLYISILLETRVVVLQNVLTAQNAGPVAHALLQGAKIVQLWHGIPMKEIGFKSMAQADILAACGLYDVLIATNASSRADWAQRFAFRDFAAIGYPRDDVFFRDPTAGDLLNVDRQVLDSVLKARQQGQAVILYAPTFRDHKGIAWFDEAKIGEMAAHCRAQGYMFLVNLHPGEQGAIPDLQQRYPDIAFLAPHTDVYPIAKCADVLLTDYSSLVLDYLLLDRPVIYYRPDHEDYISHSRPLIPGRAHYVVGEVATDVNDLKNITDRAVLAARDSHSDAFREKRHALCIELHDSREGAAGDRFCSLTLKHLDCLE